MIDPKFWVDPGVVEQFLTHAALVVFFSAKGFLYTSINISFQSFVAHILKKILKTWLMIICDFYVKDTAKVSLRPFLVTISCCNRKTVMKEWQYISSVTRQKDKSQNGCFKKTKHAKFSEKRTVLIPWYADVHAYHEVRNAHFSENLACFVFLQHPFWNSPFCLIADDIQFFSL